MKSATSSEMDSNSEEDNQNQSQGPSPSPSPKLLRRSVKITTKEAKKFIAKQLEEQVEISITKALHKAMEQLAKERQPLSNGVSNFPQRTRSNSTPALNKKKDDHDQEITSVSGSENENGYSEDEEEETETKGKKRKDPTAIILILCEVGIIILFAFFVEYDSGMVPQKGGEGGNDTTLGLKTDKSILPRYYSNYQDIQVMVFLGIGVLMSFLRNYGYSAISFSLLAGTLSVLWSILLRGIFQFGGRKIQLNILSLIYGDFAAATVLISYGCVIGILTPLQLVFMAFSEVFFYVLNDYIGSTLLQAVDTGGSIFVHIFAAYFGMALSRGLRSAKDFKGHEKDQEPTYTSNIFALIAVVILWLFWPSFNSVLSSGEDQHRVVLNTMLSLFASCLSAFATTSLFNKGKFLLVHVQNASLAGGVSVGAVVDLLICPFGALTIGAVGGVLCVIGCQFVSPLLTKVISLHDSCGVHNLHGIPGILAAFTGVIMASLAAECDYGVGLYLRYPARAPLEATHRLQELQGMNPEISPGLGRSAYQQAIYQIIAIAVTFLISIVGGVLTGLVLRLPIFSRIPSKDCFKDKIHFQMDTNEDTQNFTNKIQPTPENCVSCMNNHTLSIHATTADLRKSFPKSEELGKKGKYRF